MSLPPKEPSLERNAITSIPRFKNEASDVARASPECAMGPIRIMPRTILAETEIIAMIIGVRLSFKAKKVAATILTAEKAPSPIA